MSRPLIAQRSLLFPNWASGIVTNGLVLHLDAGNARSYSGTGTTWSDLSGSNNNGTLTNSPTFSGANGGSITFDGASTFVSTNVTTAFNDFSVCAFFRSTVTTGSYQRIVDKDYALGFWVGRDSNSSRWGGGVAEPNAPNGRFVTLADNAWHFVASVRQGTTHTVYGDGITNFATGTVTGNALNTAAIRIGSVTATTQNVLTGNIAFVAVYNRALAATEVLRNFNAIRGRFAI